MSENETLNQLALFAGASPVKTYRLPESARVFLESDQGFGSSSIEFLQSLSRDGLLSRTSPACYPATEGEILPSSFEGWQNSGIASLGGYLTLNTLEWPSAAAVCSLSEVLEADVPQKYYLSPKAARGILRRAGKRGRNLPETLQQALEAVAKELEPG